MIYYTFNPMTKAFTGQGEALRNLEETGESFLLPAWATWESPPAEDGKTAYWTDDGWELRDMDPEHAVSAFIDANESPAVKRGLLYYWSELATDAAANSVGFKDMADAISYATPTPMSQRDMDANSLKDWRNKVMAQTDFLIARVVDASSGIPTLTEFNSALPRWTRTVYQVPLEVHLATDEVPVYDAPAGS